MQKVMFRSLLGAAWIGLVAVLTPTLEQTAHAEEAILVPIVISPSTLNLESYGTWVTVHAEIPYSSVVGATVTLNGIPVKTTFADNRGELVAKFLIGDIKGIVEVGNAELKLSGTTKEAANFYGTDTIRVVSVIGR